MLLMVKIPEIILEMKKDETRGITMPRYHTGIFLKRIDFRAFLAVSILYQSNKNFA